MHKVHVSFKLCSYIAEDWITIVLDFGCLFVVCIESLMISPDDLNAEACS